MLWVSVIKTFFFMIINNKSSLPKFKIKKIGSFLIILESMLLQPFSKHIKYFSNLNYKNNCRFYSDMKAVCLKEFGGVDQM